jgi:hypothetical protein
VLCVAGEIENLRRWNARRRSGATGRAGGSKKPRVVEALALPDTKGTVTAAGQH